MGAIRDEFEKQKRELMDSSETSLRLHNANDYLYMMGDFYIADELIAELQAHDS